MRLTTYTDYALRLLMHLGVQGQELTTIAASADKYKISKNHLMKVAHDLRVMGYIEAVRGRSGGLRLARKPSDICIGDVVRRMESGSALVACHPGGAGGCLISPSCRLKGALADAMEAFYKVLDKHTLAGLINRNPSLREALQLETR